MKFLLHKNFPKAAGELLRHFDLDNEFIYIDETYPEDTATDDWVECVGKQAKGHRPIIVSVDDGIRTNAVGLVAMKKSRCTFVIFHKQWLNRAWPVLSSHLIRIWPTVAKVIQQAESEDKQCRLDVSKNGTPKRTSLA